MYISNSFMAVFIVIILCIVVFMVTMAKTRQLLLCLLYTSLEQDASLRTRIILGDGKQPVQYEAPFEPEQFPVFDFSTTSEDGIRHWEESITREVMFLIESPLYYFAVIRVGEHEGGVLLKTHHIISCLLYTSRCV